MSGTQYRTYWAGGLFSMKELMGNLELGRRVEQASGGRYAVVLPQDGECEVGGSNIAIRNADLAVLAGCDVLVANFDGTELDAGTVVEFCFAKSLDIPAVLLRTDFRDCGDRRGGDPWNLMCSGWSRTEVLWLNAMAEYSGVRQTGGLTAENVYSPVARRIVAALDRVVAMPSWLGAAEAEAQYRRMVASAGGGLADAMTAEKCHELVAAKIGRGLYKRP